MVSQTAHLAGAGFPVQCRTQAFIHDLRHPKEAVCEGGLAYRAGLQPLLKIQQRLGLRAYRLAFGSLPLQIGPGRQTIQQPVEALGKFAPIAFRDDASANLFHRFDANECGRQAHPAIGRWLYGTGKKKSGAEHGAGTQTIMCCATSSRSCQIVLAKHCREQVPVNGWESPAAQVLHRQLRHAAACPIPLCCLRRLKVENKDGRRRSGCQGAAPQCQDNRNSRHNHR